jgi:hypothetical protein
MDFQFLQAKHLIYTIDKKENIAQFISQFGRCGAMCRPVALVSPSCC